MLRHVQAINLTTKTVPDFHPLYDRKSKLHASWKFVAYTVSIKLLHVLIETRRSRVRSITSVYIPNIFRFENSELSEFQLFQRVNSNEGYFVLKFGKILHQRAWKVLCVTWKNWRMRIWYSFQIWSILLYAYSASLFASLGILFLRMMVWHEREGKVTQLKRKTVL